MLNNTISLGNSISGAAKSTESNPMDLHSDEGQRPGACAFQAVLAQTHAEMTPSAEGDTPIVPSPGVAEVNPTLTGLRQETAVLMALTARSATAGAESLATDSVVADSMAAAPGTLERADQPQTPGIGLTLMALNAANANTHATSSMPSVPTASWIEEDVSATALQNLKSTKLSNRMTLITSSEPVPDEVSLGDFARQQGIDEGTIRWLMSGANYSKPNPATQSATGAMPPNMPRPLIAQGSDTEGSDPDEAIRGGLSVTLMSGPWGTTNASGSSALAQNPPSQPLIAASSLLTGMRSALTPHSNELNPVAASTDPPLDNTSWASQSAWMRVALPVRDGMPAPVVVTAGTAPSWSANDGPGDAPKNLDLDLKAELGADWPQWWRSLMLDRPALGASAKGLGSHAASEPGIEPGASDGAQAGLSETTRADAAVSNGSTMAGASPQWKSQWDRELRQDAPVQRPPTLTGQELADKMSQAIGKRLLEAFDKGDWQLKINLKPVELGHVEVDLRMKGNSLEAHFSASQALTRDLLEGGLGRLKETLQQSGMDVASIRVNDGQSSKNGGDSTPRQNSSGFGAEARSTPNGKTGESTTTVSRPTQTPGGLDLMV